MGRLSYTLQQAVGDSRASTFYSARSAPTSIFEMLRCSRGCSVAPALTAGALAPLFLRSLHGYQGRVDRGDDGWARRGICQAHACLALDSILPCFTAFFPWHSCPAPQPVVGHLLTAAHALSVCRETLLCIMPHAKDISMSSVSSSNVALTSMQATTRLCASCLCPAFAP